MADNVVFGLVYAEVNIICILLLAFVFVCIIVSTNVATNRGYLLGIIIASIGFNIVDMFWGLIDMGIITTSLGGVKILALLYFIASSVICFLWYVYALKQEQSSIINRNWKMIPAAIPLLALLILCIVSWNTGIIYNVDPVTLEYTRGSLSAIPFVICYSYVVFVIVQCLYKIFNRKYYVHRKDYIAIISFTFPAVIFGIAQLFGGGRIPLLCVGISLGVLVYYIEHLTFLVSIDPLTQLNNRHQMVKYLSGKMNRVDPDKNLYIMLLDIDSFKMINDQHGHVTGDDALTLVADVLKYTCGPHNAFVARYGGDEFIIVYEAKSEEEIVQLSNEIKHEVKTRSRNMFKTFSLSLSLGYKVYSTDFHSIPAFIAAADKELYNSKKKKA